MSHYDSQVGQVLVRTVALVGCLKQPTKPLENNQCIYYMKQIAPPVRGDTIM